MTQGVAGKTEKIEVIKPADDDDIQSCRTFVINEEDHTIGNPLRYMTLQDGRVKYCGYAVPHPSQHKINVRIQTDGQCSAEDALRTALDNLHSSQQVLLDKYEQALENFRSSEDMQIS